MPQHGSDSRDRAVQPEIHSLALPGGVPMRFCRIPAGEFRMGARGFSPDEEPVHRVRIVEDFWLGETPVTQAQFAVWTKAERINHENKFAGKPDHPAENVGWCQAVRFCDWLTRTKSREFPVGHTMACLPTEAEWEYACRSGTETDYHTGDGEAALAEAGWCGEELGGNGAPPPVEKRTPNANSLLGLIQRGVVSTYPVEKGKPNGYGLHGMHGNVREWCHDPWDADAYRKRADGVEDPGQALRDAGYAAGIAWLTNDPSRRVFRGGSWRDSAEWCRSASRGRGNSDELNWRIGCRICLVRGTAGPKSEEVG